VSTLLPNGVISAEPVLSTAAGGVEGAGTHEHGIVRSFGRRCSWAPAFAGVTPVLIAPLLAACQQAIPSNHQAASPPAPRQATPEGDVAAAQRLVRGRLSGAEVHFLAASRSASEGVPIICGSYEQGGRTQRYVVVNREEAWVEPQMRPGQMDLAVAEYCGQGTDNRPPPATPAPGNLLWQVSPGNRQ
jgi:hypothetical protein